jgi:hypothetical protein
MPSRGDTSAFHTDPRSDLESQDFAPEFVPTAADQWLRLFTHILRAIGFIIALTFNAIIFVPFFVFGILPNFIKKCFNSTTVHPTLAPRNINGPKERSRGIFYSHGRRRIQSPDSDVSPLLLSADTSVSDFAPYGQRAASFRDTQDTFAQLPDPMIDFPSIAGGFATFDGPTITVTQPPTPSLAYTPYGSSRSSAKSDDGMEDEGLVMKNTHSVDLLVGKPKFGKGHASGMNIPGHGQCWRKYGHQAGEDFGQLAGSRMPYN